MSIQFGERATRPKLATRLYLLPACRECCQSGFSRLRQLPAGKWKLYYTNKTNQNKRPHSLVVLIDLAFRVDYVLITYFWEELELMSDTVSRRLTHRRAPTPLLPGECRNSHPHLD